MPLLVSCPACGMQGHVPDGFNAPGVQCPRCKTYVSLPGRESVHGPTRVVSQETIGASHVNPIDAFFAQIAAPPPASLREPLLAASPFPAPGTPVTPPTVSPPPPPVPGAPPSDIHSGAEVLPASPKAEQEWVQEERQRLEGYMSKQFAVLQQSREEFSRWRSQVEATLVAREQELNRQTKLLAGRSTELDGRDKDLNSRESGMVAVNDKLAAAEDSLHAVQESLMQLQLDTDAQRVVLEEFREAGEHLQMLTRRAETEYAELRAEIDKDRAAHQQELAGWRERKHQLERRQESVDHAELAMRQRLAEMEKVEGMIRHELEQKEAELARQGQTLAERQPAAPTPSSDPDESHAQRLTAMSAELDTLRTRLANVTENQNLIREELSRDQQELARNWQEVERQRDALQAKEEALALQARELAHRQQSPPPAPSAGPTQADLQRQLVALSQEVQTLRRKLAEASAVPAAAGGSDADKRLRQEMQRYQEELERNRKEVQERRQELMAEMKTNQNLRQKLAMMSRHVEELKAKLQAHGQPPPPSASGAGAPFPVKGQ